MATVPPPVELRKVWKTFDRKPVLRGIDLALAKGTILAVMGGSGTGKTVMLRIASGLIYPDSGAVSLFGVRIDRMSEEAMLPVRRRSGFVFQGAALFDSLTVFENVAFPLREHTRLSLGEITDRVHHFLALVGLPDTDELMPAELSGGMRKRAGLARAMALDPDILLVDEPSAGLDPITAGEIDQLLADLKRSGTTLVVVTHNIPSARHIGDELALLHEGHVIERGTASELDRSENELVRAFMRAEGAG